MFTLGLLDILIPIHLQIPFQLDLLTQWLATLILLSVIRYTCIILLILPILFLALQFLC